jgi:alpha-glucosidase (family GH31 glycosyl hydrolase)
MDWIYVSQSSRAKLKIRWNKELFPDHVGFLKDLHDRKLKSTLNTHPADGVRAFEKPYEAMCKALGRDSSKGVVCNLSTLCGHD